MTITGGNAAGSSGGTGGGISNLGDLTITNSAISGNIAPNEAGGIFNVRKDDNLEQHCLK